MSTYTGNAGPFRIAVAAMVFALAVAGSPHDASAQASDQPDEVHHRNDCRLARQILVHGQPANKVAWAQDVIASCDDIQETIAQALEQHRGDEVESEALDRLVFLTTEVVDANVFEAALSIAADPAAGTIGRLQAMRVVFNQFTPLNFVDFESFVDGGGFYVLPRTGDPLVLTPLPADRGQRVIDAMDSVLDEPGLDERIEEVALGLQGIADSEVRRP